MNPAVAKKIPEINAIMIPRQGIFLILAMTGSSSSLPSSTLFSLETLLVEISQFGKVGIRKVGIRKSWNSESWNSILWVFDILESVVLVNR